VRPWRRPWRGTVELWAQGGGEAAPETEGAAEAGEGVKELVVRA